MPRLILFVLNVLWAAALHAGAMPPELEKALADYRAEGTRGWAFTQTTVSSDKQLVERYNPAKPEAQRWTLLEKNGRAPTEDEIRDYRQVLVRRTRGETAPNVKDQIRPETCEALGVEGDRARYRFQLKPGAEDDSSAEHMAVTFTLHQPTGTIEQVELASIRPFSPMFAVKIQEARTVIWYTLPDENTPTLLKEIQVRVRGRAMFFKSLDQDMTVTYSDYENMRGKR
jgi:hypothetical protein